MRSLQEYKDMYREIASNLNLQGDSIELLVQMLANASYISEVENIAYVQEASLEKATLINSKIQHCMNDMYSVYRGQCPRVIIKFKPNKYFSFNPYDEIITSNDFSVYYLGYLSNTTDSDSSTAFNYAPLTIPPAKTDDDVYTIIGLIATDIVKKSWTTSDNQYYVECSENELSNDIYVKLNNSEINVTRNFSEHILNDSIFDLTIPSFGSRLYLPNPPYKANITIDALYFKYTLLSDLNENTLKKLSIKGSELVEFDTDWLTLMGYEELSTGIITLKAESRDTVSTIHYKANRDRYVNSIIRSNSDIGTLLEEYYPNKVLSGGTNYKFTTSSDGETILTIYYIPKGDEKIDSEEITKFITDRGSYFITDKLYVKVGICYDVVFSIDVELYEKTSVDEDIKSILSNYSNKFNINLENNLSEITSLISKVSNIKLVKNIDKVYLRGGETITSLDTIYNDLSNVYFNVSCKINSTL